MWQFHQSFLLYVNSYCDQLQLKSRNHHLFHRIFLPIRKHHLYPF